MYTFYDKYCAFCLAHGISPSAAATKSGLSKAAVTKWKTNETYPSYSTVYKIATAFNMDVDAFRQELDSYIQNEDEQKKVHADSVCNPAEQNIPYVPVLKSVSKTDNMFEESNIETYVLSSHISNHSFAIRQIDDSMEKDGIHSGDIVIVDADCSSADGISVVRVDGEVLIRRVTTMGSVVVLSAGTDKTSVYSILEHKIEIIGRVVTCIHDF